ncbi:MAG: hypothetical protein JSS87_02875 [Acidobacteria bacterium]|nr:hypothetical protein [Acidobacteriota bacterium]
MIQEAPALPAYPPLPKAQPKPELRVAEEQHSPGLFGWRSTAGFGTIEAAVLCLYVTVLAIALRVHEPWGDEAQAWLIARDSSFWNIFRTRLHYEGAPLLWHTLLHVAAVLHVPWAAIPYLSGVVAVAGIYVLLRWSPFPLAVRALLPFTFFLQYQYAAVARSYVFFPLLLFAMCALYSTRKRHVVAFAVVAGLFVNLSLHGMVIGSVLVALYAWKLRMEYLRRRASRLVFVVPFPKRKQMMTAAALFFAMWAAAIYVAIPAPDVTFAVGDAVKDGAVHRTLVSLIGELPGKPVVPDPPPPPPPKPMKTVLQKAAYVAPPPPHPVLYRHPLDWLTWQSMNPPGGAGPVFADVADNVLTILSEITWPVSRSNVIACVFVFLWLVWMAARGRLLLALPWAAVIVVGSVLWVADHHGGMYLITMLACAWMAARGGRHAPAPWLERSFTVALLVICGIQIGWSFTSVRNDVRGAYDPGHATALYLQEHPIAGETAAFHFQTTSIQPYFQHNPFFNMPASYWVWSRNVDADGHYKQTLAQHPARVVYAVEFLGDGSMRNQWTQRNVVDGAIHDAIYDALLSRGYREKARFCGRRFSRMGDSYRVCDFVMEPMARGRWWRRGIRAAWPIRKNPHPSHSFVPVGFEAS